MKSVGSLLVLLIHVIAIIDAYPYLKKPQGWIRMLLAIFPPLFGPMIYFITRNSYRKTIGRKKFMEGKRRYS